MPDDINKRMNYFDRQFLRAADFKVEQEYHLYRHRLHNRLLHTPGLGDLTRLDVTGKLGDAKVFVGPGEAIDKDGREIVLSSEHEVRLPPDIKPGKYALVLSCKEAQSDPSTDPGVEGRMRIEERPSFDFEILAGDAPTYADLTLAEIQIGEDGTLAAKPKTTSIRKRAGTVVGSGTTFDTVTANSFTLTDPDGKETVKITGDGAMVSPMWSVVQWKKELVGTSVAPAKLITEIPFNTKGGDLLIFASGSVSLASATPPQEDGIAMGINIYLDNAELPLGGEPSVPGCAKPGQLAAAVATTLWVPGGQPARRTLKLKATEKTKLSRNDFYSVMILELPFNKSIS